ncbi:MAG: FtsX-like permease family protein [Bacteroidota bacterium]
MLRNYLTTAIRNLAKRPAFTMINVLGLAIGMAACIIITLYVRYELSFDRFHEQSDRIYRVSRQWFNQAGESTLHLGHVAPPFGPLLKNDFPHIIEHSVRLLQDGRSPLISLGERSFSESNFFFADEDFFKLFTFQTIEGDLSTALTEPNAVVLTESTALKYFQKTDVVGEVLNYQNMMDIKITAVVEDVPPNAHYHFDFLCSFETVENFFGRENLMQNFGSNNYATYLLLPEGYDPADLSAQLPGFLDKHMGERNGVAVSVFNKLHLWPLTSIHLHSNLDSEIEANGDITTVYVFGFIAALILLIACINFINLSTAQSSKRAKEVGLRKVVGAQRLSIIRQFLLESVVLALIALVLAVGMVVAGLQIFNPLFDLHLSLNPFKDGGMLLLLVGIAVFAGLIAGSYPALYLSGFQPVSILRGPFNPANRGRMRAALVIVQFTISIALIIGVGIVQEQLAFMKNKPLGFDKESIVVLPSNDEMYGQYESIKARLMAQPGISDVSISSRVPSGRLLDSQGGRAEVKGKFDPITTRVADIHVDHEFLTTFRTEIVAGRNFDVKLASDSTEAFILNEAAVAAIGWDNPQEAIDKKFAYGRRQGRVIGVVRDFHFESLHQTIAPIVFLITQGRANVISVRMHASKRTETLDYLRNEWEHLRTGFPFTYYFVDEQFEGQYQDEERQSTLVGYFSILAVIIAALGLLGLASFTAQQRYREIGIRKVLGASTQQIVYMLTQGFTRLVVIAIVLAMPLAYLLMNRLWLKQFAYQANFAIWPYLLAGGLALIVAWLTIGYQSFRAAQSDPVEAIRAE